MSKTSETKNKILELLKQGNKRLIDIYPALGLSPATVSQHLKELKRMNLINEIDNSHFKNEKYYSINKNYAENNYITNKPSNKIFQRLGIGVIVIILVLAGGLFILSNHGSPQSVQNNNVSLKSAQQSTTYNTLNVLLTDPPHVPIGTTSLNITYSAIQIHLANSSSNKWITLNSSGQLDLLSLVNVSKLIGSVQIPTNSMINLVAFNITNAEIGIGNQSYPVSLSVKRVVGQVSSNSSFNGTSDLLVDFSPTVITLYNENSTTFEMVPSLSAVIVDQKHIIEQQEGNSEEFTFDNDTSYILRDLSSGLNVTQSSITAVGNNTKISITLKDTSNQSIDLQQVLIFGNESLYLNSTWPPMPMVSIAVQGGGQFPESPTEGVRIFSYRNGANQTYAYNYSYNGIGAGRRNNFSNGNFTNPMPMPPGGMGGYGYFVTGDQDKDFHINFTNAYNWSSGKINSSWSPGSGVPPPISNGQWTQIGGFFNVPANMSINSSSGPQMIVRVNQAYTIGMTKQSLQVISFAVNRNATLSLPDLDFPMPYAQNMRGYTLSPGQSVTLTFNGTVGLGGDLLRANFTSGTKYRIDVISSNGVFAESNATVS